MTEKHELHIVVRFLWFIFFGGWLATVAAVAAYAIAFTIIGLPVSFWIAGKLGKIATLNEVYF